MSTSAATLATRAVSALRAPSGARLKRSILIAFVALLAAVTTDQVVTWPNVARLASQIPSESAFMKIQERRTHASVDQQWVSYDAISTELKLAVLVSEDVRFFEHHGFDTTAIRLSIRDAWRAHHLPIGASTITQQLARNLWLSPSRDPLRKIKEAVLTVELEHDLSKRRILELYLNVVQFGPGIFGAQAASRAYFGHDASTLTPREAAELAASLPAPSVWHPGAYSPRYDARIPQILALMHDDAWLRARL